MAIRVADLVGQACLRIEVLAGASGLGRKVSWAHASDLPDPWNWLAGGELLLKNGRSLARSSADQVTFLDELAHASVAGLVIGDDPHTPDLAARAVSRANELHLPVLKVPYRTSFIEISRTVADASTEEQSRHLARIERIYCSIQPESTSDVDSNGSFTQRLGAALGHRVYVVDGQRAGPVLGSPSLPSALANALRAALAEQQDTLPGVLHLPAQGRRSAVCVPVPFEEPTLLVATRTTGGGFDLSVLHHAASAAATTLSQATLREDLAAQPQAAVLADLLPLEERTPGQGATERELDLDLSRSVLVATTAADRAATRRAVIGLRRRGVRHTVVTGRDGLWVLVEDEPADETPASQTDSDAGTLDDLVLRLGRGAALGASAPVRVVSRLGDASREARVALRIAAKRGGGVARYGSAGVLPAFHDPVASQALVDDVLGPLLEYDREHGTELLASLTAFLVNRRSWSRTATALRLHRQTVVYRMQRVEKLTRRDLTETGNLAELWLAITAHELLSDDDGRGPRRSVARARPTRRPA
nr:PucR family transcriptional regulator ligand-binding domain-containing protein [Actinomycetota bacterium]